MSYFECIILFFHLETEHPTSLGGCGKAKENCIWIELTNNTKTIFWKGGGDYNRRLWQTKTSSTLLSRKV